MEDRHMTRAQLIAILDASEHWQLDASGSPSLYVFKWPEAEWAIDVDEDAACLFRTDFEPPTFAEAWSGKHGHGEYLSFYDVWVLKVLIGIWPHESYAQVRARAAEIDRKDAERKST